MGGGVLRVRLTWPKSATMDSSAGGGWQNSAGTELLHQVEAGDSSFPSRPRDFGARGDSLRLSVATGGAEKKPLGSRGGGAGPADGDAAQWGGRSLKAMSGCRQKLAVKAFQCRVLRSDLNKSAVFSAAVLHYMNFSMWRFFLSSCWRVYCRF